MTTHAEQEDYMVELKPKDESWKRDGCFGMCILIAVLCLVSQVNDKENWISNGINWAILLIGVVLLGMMYAPQKPEVKIRVSADSFTVIRTGKTEQAYRFSEITRVRCFYPLVMAGKTTMNSGPRSWQIDVEDQCAAVFTEEMENYLLLLCRLDELGLITPYGTGESGRHAVFCRGTERQRTSEKRRHG